MYKLSGIKKDDEAYVWHLVFADDGFLYKNLL